MAGEMGGTNGSESQICGLEFSAFLFGFHTISWEILRDIIVLTPNDR